MDKVFITWYVNDGVYQCQGRPITFTVDKSEFEGCETESEINDVIEELVKNEFENNVSYIVGIVSGIETLNG